MEMKHHHNSGSRMPTRSLQQLTYLLFFQLQAYLELTKCTCGTTVPLSADQKTKRHLVQCWSDIEKFHLNGGFRCHWPKYLYQSKFHRNSGKYYSCGSREPTLDLASIRELEPSFKDESQKSYGKYTVSCAMYPAFPKCTVHM